MDQGCVLGVASQVISNATVQTAKEKAKEREVSRVTTVENKDSGCQSEWASQVY